MAMNPLNPDDTEEPEEFSATSELLRRAFAAELRLVPVPRVTPIHRVVPVIAPWAWGMAAALVCAGIIWVGSVPREEPLRDAATAEASPRDSGEPSFRIALVPGPERNADGPSAGTVPVEHPPVVWSPAASAPPFSGSSWSVERPAMTAPAGTAWEPGGLALDRVPQGLRAVREHLRRGEVPAPEAVSVAEVVASFRYRLRELGPVSAGPEGAFSGVVTACPWDPARSLAVVVGEPGSPDVRFAVSFLPGRVSAYRRLGGGETWSTDSPVADVLARENWASQAVAVYELIPARLGAGTDDGAWMRVEMASAHGGGSRGLLEVSEEPGQVAESGFAVAVAGAALAWSGDASARNAWEVLVEKADRAVGTEAARREWVSWMRQVPPTMSLIERR